MEESSSNGGLDASVSLEEEYEHATVEVEKLIAPVRSKTTEHYSWSCLWDEIKYVSMTK